MTQSSWRTCAVAAVAAALVAPMSAHAATKTTTKATTPTTRPAPTTAPATTVPAKTLGKSGGTFVDARTFITGDPTTIDPGLASVVNESQVANLLYDGLVEIDYETGELKASVAESYTLNATATVATFKLRKGVKFSNGEDVLPSSFKCSWERLANPDFASPLSYHLDSIQGKLAVDEKKSKTISGIVADDAALTLTVRLAYPYSDFISETQHTLFSPLTKEGCAAGRTYHDGLIVGNGPFKLAETWKRGQFIKLVRNDTYFGGIHNSKSLLDAIEFKILRDEIVAFNLFEAGQADAGPIPAGRFTELTKKYGDRASKDAQLTIQYLGLNWDDPIVGGFANTKLRLAISVAIDRAQINEAIFNGSRAEATGFTPPGIDGVKPTTFGLTAKADQAKAKQLLAEWGKPLAKPLALRCVNTQINVQICSIIKKNLEDVGIAVEVDAQPGTGYFDRLRAAPGQLFRSGWAADFVGYDNFMYPLFSTESIGNNNLFRFSVKTVDDAIIAGRRSTDPKRKADSYYSAEKQIMDTGIVVPLWWNRWSTLLGPKVDKFPQGPTAFIDYSIVSMK